MLRVIKEVKPKWVIGENVRGLLSWNGGMVFHEVCADLEREGYEVQPFLIPAAGVNAPHQRYRVWFVAHSNGLRLEHSENGADIHRGEGQAQGEGSESSESIEANGEVRNATDTLHEGLQGGQDTHKWEEHNTIWRGDGVNIGAISEDNQWDSRINFSEFPTQPPVRRGNDGVSEALSRYINSKLYATISQRYTDKDLQEVRERISKEEVWEKIRRLYKIREKAVLLKVLQLCSPTNTEQIGFSVFSEEASEKTMRKLQVYGEIGNTPQGLKLEKQFYREFGNTLPILSHKIALVAMEAERAALNFMSWHRKESIKAYGNAIVPQIAIELFKTINVLESYERLDREKAI